MSPRVSDSGSYCLIHSSLMRIAACLTALLVEKKESTLELVCIPRTCWGKGSIYISCALDMSQVGVTEPFSGHLEGTLP